MQPDNMLLILAQYPRYCHGTGICHAILPQSPSTVLCPYYSVLIMQSVLIIRCFLCRYGERVQNHPALQRRLVRPAPHAPPALHLSPPPRHLVRDYFTCPLPPQVGYPLGPKPPERRGHLRCRSLGDQKRKRRSRKKKA